MLKNFKLQSFLARFVGSIMLCSLEAICICTGSFLFVFWYNLQCCEYKLIERVKGTTFIFKDSYSK